jgi:hypothetical protein
MIHFQSNAVILETNNLNTRAMRLLMIRQNKPVPTKFDTTYD